jgi:hypothetical protein
LVQRGHDGRIQIGQVLDLGLVQRLQQAAFDLRLGKHGTGHDDVVPRVARHQFGVQRLVGLKGVVVDLDAGFLFEGGNHAFGM